MSTKIDRVIRLAKHYLRCPEGAWPETVQAREALISDLPKAMTLEQAIEHGRCQNRAEDQAQRVLDEIQQEKADGQYDANQTALAKGRIFQIGIPR